MPPHKIDGLGGRFEKPFIPVVVPGYHVVRLVKIQARRILIPSLLAFSQKLLN